MVCRNDSIRCYVNDSLIHEVLLPPIPALVANATLDRQTQTILLKVVNTTLHDEVTEINLRGASVSNQATLIRMTGLPEDRNTYESPLHVAPMEDAITFSLGRAITCKFPPNSITILQLHWD
jgi:alpha-L-arabinofuranosidase